MGAAERNGRNHATATSHVLVTKEAVARSGPTAPAAKAATTAPEQVKADAMVEPQGSMVRRVFFRCLRLTVAGALVTTAAVYTRTSITTARSVQACIHAEITALRAPIPGEVRLEGVVLGQTLAAGSELFRIDNARFGNEQAFSQLNWVTELAQRLRAESEEAAVRFNQQEEVAREHERMFQAGVIPRLEWVEERNKLALAGTVMTNKLALARKAEERVAELKRQSELQESATVTMPFEGAAWVIAAKNGAQVALNETVMEVINPDRVWVEAFFHERHAEKLRIGGAVNISTAGGASMGRGIIESIRGGAGRIRFEGEAAVNDGQRHQRIVARIRLETENPFGATEFYGVGRNVVVTTLDGE